MASSGPNGAGTGASGSGTGTRPWSNPDRITADDGSFADSTYTGAGTATTEYLKATAFSFSIPAGSTIDGIVVEIKRYYTGTYVNDSRVYLLKAGSEAGSNKSAGGAWPTSSSYSSFGGASDLWGTTWSVSDINDSGFGAYVSPTLWGFGGTATAFVDHVRITVYYTAAAAGGMALKRLRQSRNASLLRR